MTAHGDVFYPSVRVQIAGHIFELHEPDVSRLVSRTEPAEIRDHFVEIGGRRYPVKQAIAAVTGLDLSDFTSQHARSALRRLGLPVGRLSAAAKADAPRGGAAAGGSARTAVRATEPASMSPDGERGDPAAALRAYRNRWVALQRNQVLTDQDSFAEVLSWLRGNGIKADAVFLVPDDPERIRRGMTG
jgi:hypothetical protein